MSRLIRHVLARLTYANVVATVALFAALGTGGAYAASQLSKNSVGNKQLRRNAVTSGKVKNGSLGVGDLSKKARRNLAGVTGPSGPTGPAGATGAQGPPGVTDFAVVSSGGGRPAGTATAVQASNNVYAVSFDRSVSKCAYTATPSLVPISGGAVPEAPSTAAITTSDDGANTVIVKTWSGGAATPFGFRLILAC